MENRFAFTQANIRDLSIPESGRKDYYDSKVSKLVCRVSSTGNKTFAVINRIGGKVYRVTVGNANEISVKEAQDIALVKLGEMAKGVNPVKEKLKVLTLEEALKHYIKNRHPRNGKDLKPRTVQGYRYALDNSFSDWKAKPVGSITPDMVVKRYASLTRVGVGTANVGARVLRLILKHAKAIGAVDSVATDILVDKNSWNRDVRRKRIIKMAEIQPWFEAVNVLSNERAKIYFLMLMFMGFRVSEALGLVWKDVNFKKKTITVRDTKNGSDFTQPIPMHFLSYLERLSTITGDSKWVFAGVDPAKHMTIPKKQITKVIQMTDIEFSSHDLRRSFAGYAEAVGIPYSIIKKLMNHTISSKDVTMGYLITEDETLADSINKIGAFIHAKATQKDNIIQLHANH